MLLLKNYAVIGWPISHSLSPLIQNTLFAHHGINGSYGILPINPADFANFLQIVRQADLSGCNITMPYKQAVLLHLHSLSPEVRLLQSANTICLQKEGWCGHSTDAAGFRYALKEQNVSLLGQKALLLGSGGAGRAVAMALAQEGIGHITIINKNAAENNFSWLQASFPELSICCHAADAGKIESQKLLIQAAKNTTICINATPLGMKGHPEDFPDFAFLQALPKNCLVCDLIYEPQQSSFLAAALTCGLAATNGLNMLIGQALASFQIFTGQEVAADSYKIVKAALVHTLNIN